MNSSSVVSAGLWEPTETSWTNDNTDGLFICEFIEGFCRITKGPYGGQRVRLRTWQGQFICELFARREDGLRRYRRGIAGWPRKNSKSFIGSALALDGLVDDEMGAEVYSCAGDKDQARIVFGEAKTIVQMDQDLSERLKVYRDAIEDPKTHSVYRVLSADAPTKEGLNPYRVIFDEVHVQPNENLWNVMTLGSGTREQPLIIGLTTAGFDKDSLCYRLYDYGKKIQSGEKEDDTFFFHWLEPDDPNCDYTDPKVWKQCNPALGDFLYEEDFEVAVRQTPEAAFRRYRLNQWTTVRESWLPHGVWGKCEKPQPIEDGAEVVLGFDGSYSGDSTALVACTVEGHLTVVAAWEKPSNDPDWRVDIADVEEKIRQACRAYTVLEVACDPYRWQRTMQILEAEGIPIVEWPTNSVARMVPACAKFYDAVIDGRITHDGNQMLTRHVENAVIKSDRYGPRIVKEHKMSSRRIDLAVAAVIAHDRATFHREEESEPEFISL